MLTVVLKLKKLEIIQTWNQILQKYYEELYIKILPSSFCQDFYTSNFRATPVLLAATALVYRTDEIIQSLEP